MFILKTEQMSCKRSAEQSVQWAEQWYTIIRNAIKMDLGNERGHVGKEQKKNSKEARREKEHNKTNSY